jgi:predicted YcjX-like family ATPase
MVATILDASRLASDVLQLRSTFRIGITGLARAGKTALLTSLAANLLAVSAGRPALPAVSDAWPSAARVYCTSGGIQHPKV